MKKNILNILIFSGLVTIVSACANNRSDEIGDPSLPSPGESQNYSTISDAFSRYDTNGDGYLDEHEFSQLQSDPVIIRIRKATPELEKSGPLLFVEVDENGDGLISLNELTVIIQPLITKPKN